MRNCKVRMSRAKLGLYGQRAHRNVRSGVVERFRSWHLRAIGKARARRLPAFPKKLFHIAARVRCQQGRDEPELEMTWPNAGNSVTYVHP